MCLGYPVSVSPGLGLQTGHRPLNSDPDICMISTLSIKSSCQTFKLLTITLYLDTMLAYTNIIFSACVWKIVCWKKCFLLTFSVIWVKALLEVLSRIWSNTLCLFWCERASSLHRGNSVPLPPSISLSHVHSLPSSLYVEKLSDGCDVCSDMFG